MNMLAWIIVVGGVIVATLIIVFSVISLRIGQDSVFKGSGVPASMAQMILSSVHITAQHLIGVLIVVIISLLMAQQVLTTEAGLPLLSAVAGYLLGKSFKDVSFSSEA